MLIIAQSRLLHMKDVLSHPLGPILWALANGDGSLWKILYKAVPARELETLDSPAKKIPEQLLSIVQKFKGNDKTFSELA